MFKILSLILLLSFQIADAKQTKSYFDNAVQLADNVWVGRQPDAHDLLEFKAKGIDNVVSVSTAKEVKKNSYDESTKFIDLGIGYNWLELGRLKSHTPDKLAEFDQLLLNSPGNSIVIYSKNLERAKQLMAVWMIKYQNAKITPALEAVDSKTELVSRNMMALLGMSY